MKKIGLTKEQKSRLLEMCNKLFSEYGKWFTVLDGSIYYSEKGEFPGFKIHWYEFCILHLADRVFKMKSKSSIHINSKKIRMAEFTTISKSNPIDYLYDEYKQV